MDAAEFVFFIRVNAFQQYDTNTYRFGYLFLLFTIMIHDEAM